MLPAARLLVAHHLVHAAMNHFGRMQAEHAEREAGEARAITAIEHTDLGARHEQQTRERTIRVQRRV